jgi:uncharacterized protein (TIGR03000 family)
MVMFQPRIYVRFLVFSALALHFAFTTTGWADATPDVRATPLTGGQRAEIPMNVPLNAIVFADGQCTDGSGVTRRFVTPPLAPDNKYYYDVKITWIEGNLARVYNRHLSFRAGERVAVNLTQDNWTEYAQDLYMDPAAPAPWRADYYRDPLNAPNNPPNSLYIFPGTRLYPR